MIDIIRQKKINEVIGKIMADLAYDQHINSLPVTVSVGIRNGTGMIRNVIVIHEAPREILNDLMYLEERFPGVEIAQRQGGIWIDCEYIVLDNRENGTFGGRLRALLGCEP